MPASPKIGFAFRASTLCVNYLVKRKIELLQKIEAISFMKLNAVTARQSTSVNLNGLQDCVQMNTKLMSGDVIVKRRKLRDTDEKHILTLAGIRRKLLIEKTG